MAFSAVYLLKISHDSWLVNDGIQTNLASSYAWVIDLFNTSATPGKVSLEGDKFSITEAVAIKLTLVISTLIALVAILVGLVSVKIRQSAQVGAMAVAVGLVCILVTTLATK